MGQGMRKYARPDRPSRHCATSHPNRAPRRLYNAGMRGLPVALLLLAAALHAQQTMPVGILRGNLVAWQNGSLSIRQADGAVYDCSYDNHTLFQRNRWPIQSSELAGGEPVEVVSDRWPATRACYVRMVSVVYALPKSPRRRAQPAEAWVPRGYLTYSGL